MMAFCHSYCEKLSENNNIPHLTMYEWLALNTMFVIFYNIFEVRKISIYFYQKETSHYYQIWEKLKKTWNYSTNLMALKSPFQKLKPNVSWSDPGLGFRLLGIDFTNNLVGMECNVGKIEEIISLFNSWMHRTMSVYGKVVVIKTSSISFAWPQ